MIRTRPSVGKCSSRQGAGWRRLGNPPKDELGGRTALGSRTILGDFGWCCGMPPGIFGTEGRLVFNAAFGSAASGVVLCCCFGSEFPAGGKPDNTLSFLGTGGTAV